MNVSRVGRAPCAGLHHQEQPEVRGQSRGARTGDPEAGEGAGREGAGRQGSGPEASGEGAEGAGRGY